MGQALRKVSAGTDVATDSSLGLDTDLAGFDIDCPATSTNPVASGNAGERAAPGGTMTDDKASIEAAVDVLRHQHQVGHTSAYTILIQSAIDARMSVAARALEIIEGSRGLTFELSMSSEHHLTEVIARLNGNGINAGVGRCGPTYEHVLEISGIEAAQVGIVRGWVLQIDPVAELIRTSTV